MEYTVPTLTDMGSYLSRRAFLSTAVFAPSLLRHSTVTRKAAPGISPEDDAFLEELEKSNFQFFWEQADPQPAW